MVGRIHPEDLPDYWQLSPDAQWQAYKDQQKRDRRKLTSWFLPIVACLPAVAFMTLKPVNDGVSLVGNALGLMGAAASWVTPQPPQQSEQTAGIDDPKIMAFLDTIAWAEGTGNSYDIQYTFAKFSGFADHPRAVQCDETGELCSDAAGRYQYLSTTWDGVASSLGLTDFSPQSQDKAAIQSLKNAGVYDLILAGNIKEASCAVGSIWASFPCNDYGQGQKDESQLEQVYQEKLAARLGQKTASAVQPTIATTGFKEWQVSLPQGTDNSTALVAIGLSKLLGLKVVDAAPSGSSTAVATSKTVFPIAGETWQSAAKTSGFGDRVHPISGKAAFHHGQDLGAAAGQPVLATESGTVADVKFSDSGCGNEITLTFADGQGARYCHLSAIHVEKGQAVKVGDVIGDVGSTGDSTAPHLHFERIENGASVDPAAYLQSLGNRVTPEPAAAPSTPTSQGALKWQFQFDPSVSQEQQQAVNEAAAKLSAIVTTDKTLSVTVQTENKPGEFMAKGKPLTDSLDPIGLPTKGIIILNTSYPVNAKVVEHELLHVLGIGTIPNWKAAVDPTTHTYKADTLAGASYGGAIPLSNDDSHWSEEALKDGLMTPYAETINTDMPIETITIEALKDLGWSVSGVK